MRSAINRDNGATLSDWRDERNTRSLWDSPYARVTVFLFFVWFFYQMWSAL